MKNKRNTTSWSCQENGGFWSPKPHLCLNAEYYFENNTVEAARTLVITDDGLSEFLIWNTVFTMQSLLDEVLPWGFRVSSVHDDVCGRLYAGDADTLCIVLQREMN